MPLKPEYVPATTTLRPETLTIWKPVFSFSDSIPSEVSLPLSSCYDLHRYFQTVFPAHEVDTPQDPTTTAATSGCLDICFLCTFLSDTTRSLAEHLRNEHIIPCVREYLNGTATDLELVLLFHYACVRNFPLGSCDPASTQDSDHERRRFYMKYRTYWPTKEIDRPDEQDFSTIAAHLRKLAVKEYSRYVAFKAHKAQREQRRAALQEAERSSQWRCSCGAIALSLAKLSSHIAAASETGSIAEASGRFASQHGWVGNQRPMIVDTRTFSDLHRKLVHQYRILE
jgi:hypothetical protein